MRGNARRVSTFPRRMATPSASEPECASRLLRVVDENLHVKKGKRTRLKKNETETRKSYENSTNFCVTEHKEREMGKERKREKAESDTNFRSASRVKLKWRPAGVNGTGQSTRVYLPKGCQEGFYCSSTLLPRGEEWSVIAAGINFNNCSALQ